jgi:hypothetical protein
VDESASKKACPAPTESFVLANGATLTFNRACSTQHYNHFDFRMRTLDDLLALDAFYVAGGVSKEKTANIPFARIHRVAPCIRKLAAMIGIDDVKAQVLNIVAYFLQSFERENNDMLHTVVYGGPGVGKTRFINVLAELYAALGVLPSAKVTVAKRADMVGQYLGHTAAKTTKVLEKACGGVLLIDEAYSMADKEQRDSFSRECIDTLNQFLSERKSDIICVIAGYKEELEERFFKSNPGLERRFPFRISIGDYTAAHLRDIFVQIAESNGWHIDVNAAPVAIFEENRDHFRFNGGDMETLFTKTKFIHSMRVFGGALDAKGVLSKTDVAEGIAAFLDNDQVRARKEMKDMVAHMYV